MHRYWPSYINPWWMRIPFGVFEFLLVHGPTLKIRKWASRNLILTVDMAGPFAAIHGGGWIKISGAMVQNPLVPKT